MDCDDLVEADCRVTGGLLYAKPVLLWAINLFLIANSLSIEALLDDILGWSFLGFERVGFEIQSTSWFIPSSCFAPRSCLLPVLIHDTGWRSFTWWRGFEFSISTDRLGFNLAANFTGCSSDITLSLLFKSVVCLGGGGLGRLVVGFSPCCLLMASVLSFAC